MKVLDLVKASVVCGGMAFVVYCFPTAGQIVVIGVLNPLWLAYAYKTLATIRRKWLA